MTSAFKREYIARFAIIMFLVASAIRTQHDGIRYLCLSLAGFFLITVLCLVVIERDGDVERAKRFRDKYINSHE